MKPGGAVFSFLKWGTLVCVYSLAGCASPRSSATTSPRCIAQNPANDTAQRLEREPRVLEEMLQRADRLDQYEVTFYRQERNGTFVQKLGPLEEIRAKFRKQPFSVTFEWPRSDADYAWSVYVEGKNGNKLTVRERKGILGLPPQTRVVDIMDPVRFGRSKNPITSFGLAQLVRESLDSFHEPSTRKLLKVRFEGLVSLDPMDRRAYYLRIESPPSANLRYTRQDLYIDAQTLLPAGTDLYTSDGKLDAKYRYADLNTHVRLTDGDFRIDGRS